MEKFRKSQKKKAFEAKIIDTLYVEEHYFSQKIQIKYIIFHFTQTIFNSKWNSGKLLPEKKIKMESSGLIQD